MNVPTIAVLGTPLLLTSYAELQAACQRAARLRRAVAIEFTNTQIVAMRRHDPSFHQDTRAFDYFVPDGMPLIWCLNLAGAHLSDRVYGPSFMRMMLSELPEGSTHFLVGGSQTCGALIQERFSRINPGLRFVGAFHGTCQADGVLAGSAESEIVDEINRLSPDYIWLGLGAPKQERWINRHKHLIRSGVILSVGFAFDVNAGLKVDAPTWMQRAGLTWLFRLLSEPQRLGMRYLRYNSLFLGYLVADGLRGKAWATSNLRRT
jgi:N-acetylglucosaminyldiphosphoundecaprenol N-acetyl-beta-D-mannosaminyltransferase